jgi:aspartyl-tRNA(Asn)/glutamyl-tRNA(Gln) amidotransferase subunit B
MNSNKNKKNELSKYLVNDYLPTIGIECHVQLKTKTKLFSSVSNEARDAEPNTLINHVCFGLPGALPVLNEEAVRLASKAAYALGTTPQHFSKFDRKHYFYPDLPKGYQISQYDQPIILGGQITIYLEDGSTKIIHITRAHLEEDAGKSTHPIGADFSLVDLNRAGTPLLEIVSEPEIHNSAEAKAYTKELWLRMKYAGVSDVDLYHGNMRFDVNVSVSKDHSVLGTRSETKNLNSFRSVERAVDYEIKRQIELLEKGQNIVQETRGWLDDKQKTVSQRSKEDAHDYRYFPDPDIPPIVLDEQYISSIEQHLPVMPNEWRDKLHSLGIDNLQTESLLETQVEFDADFLQLIVKQDSKRAKAYANWITNIEVPLRRQKIEAGGLQIKESTRINIFETVYMLSEAGKISSNGAKSIIEELLVVFELPKDIEQYAESKGYIQMNDSGELEKIVEQIITENPKPVEDVRNGEMKAIGFLVGQVMKLSKGKANPAEAQRILKYKLGV